MSDMSKEESDVLWTKSTAMLIGYIIFFLCFVQGVYGVVEAFRHYLIGDSADHAMAHLKAAWPALWFILAPQPLRVAWRWIKRKTGELRV